MDGNLNEVNEIIQTSDNNRSGGRYAQEIKVEGDSDSRGSSSSSLRDVSGMGIHNAMLKNVSDSR